VTLVAPVIVNVEENAPDVVKEPPKVKALVPNCNPAKVGELLVAIACGRLSVTAPVDELAIISFAVPVMLDTLLIPTAAAKFA
jgi:hypothetical protein